MDKPKKDLRYFMRSTDEEIVSVPGPESIKDDEGNTVMLDIRVLSQETINKINDMYRRRTMATDKKGNPLVSGGEVIWKTEKDNAKASRHIIVEALQYPDLKDPELMRHYGCVDVTEMPLKVFSRPDEYQHVARMVMQTLGMLDPQSDEDLEEAKN